MSFQAKHIFVPVAVAPTDELSLAESLVDAACDLAKSAGEGARLTLAYVSGPQIWLAADTGLTPSAYYQTMAEIAEENRRAAYENLQKLKKRAESRGVNASAQVVDAAEGTGEAIAHAAGDSGADLIALLSHGRRGLKRLFLGSVAERVAHVATKPVLILRAPQA